MYVLDRTTGEVLSATPFVHMTSSHDVDLKTGRLIPVEAKKPKVGVVVRDVCPAAKRLFSFYNCNGCHANGGGGIGPALSDDEWIYGFRPAQIFATIVHVHAGEPWRVDALEDQQLAGLLMWIPAGGVFILVGLALFAAWLGEAERRVAFGRTDALSHGTLPRTRRGA